MTIEFMLAGVIVVSLITYALSGGADFGGGAWNLFAYGKRKNEHQQLIEKAIAPIWETNHVWIILVIVILFVAFPLAFSAITIALHIPLTLMLIGIVLRGSAFIFHSYGNKQDKKLQKFWGNVFAISSLLTPITFGICVGAVASGNITVDIEKQKVLVNFIDGWWGVFPFSIGVFCLFIFMFLAAVYLIYETNDDLLKEDFRKRALISAVLVDVCAVVCLYLSQAHAVIFWEGLFKSKYAFLFHASGTILAIAIFYTLSKRKYQVVRILAIAKVVCIVFGWAICQFPYLVVPNITIYTATAPKNVLTMMFIIIVIGMIVTVPALIYLYRVFKR